MQYTTTMTSKGQVTIPVKVRRLLGLQPGQPVQFKVVGNTVKIESNNWREDLEQLQARVRAHMQQKKLPFPAPQDFERIRAQAGDAAAADRLRRTK